MADPLIFPKALISRREAAQVSLLSRVLFRADRRAVHARRQHGDREGPPHLHEAGPDGIGRDRLCLHG